MTSIDDMAAEIMRGLTEYADLADTAMKAAVKKTATSVKKEISANAPKRSGKYRKSWTSKKTKENSHSLEMTVHSKDRYQLAHLLEKGHAKRNGGRVSGKPHIAPAEAHGEEMLTQLIETCESTDQTTYDNWYNAVYMPTAAATNNSTGTRSTMTKSGSATE